MGCGFLKINKLIMNEVYMENVFIYFIITLMGLDFFTMCDFFSKCETCIIIINEKVSLKKNEKV